MSRRKIFTPFLVLVATGFAANGLLLFTDHSIWDGLLYLHSYGWTGGREAMWQLFNEAGRPLDHLGYLLAFETGQPVFFAKAAGIVSWTVCGILCRRVLRKAGSLGTAESTLIAALGVSLPVFDVLGDFSMWMHTTSLVFFWVAAALLVDLPLRRGPLHAWLRAAALILFFVSFNLNSLLVFFYVLAVSLAVLRWEPCRTAVQLRAASKLVLRHADFAVLPVFFWILKSLLTPTSGHYADYNKPVFSLQVVWDSIPAFFKLFLIPEPVFVGVSPWFALAAVLAAVLAAAVLGSRRAVRASSSGGRLLLAGTFLLAGAVAPYFLVGQFPASHGWWARNAILTGLPLGMGLVGFSILATRLLQNRFTAAWTILPLALLVLGVVASNRAILRLQGLGAKHEAVRLALQREIADADPLLVQLRDYFPLPETVDSYPPVIWSSLAAREGLAPRTIVFDTIPLAPHQETVDEKGRLLINMPFLPMDDAAVNQLAESTTVPQLFKEMPREGPQILVVLREGSLGNNGVQLGWRHLFFKWLEPEKRPDFFRNLVEVVSSPLPPVRKSSVQTP
ncbi:MAG: hypothetical protein ACKOAS_02625 [Verrucomicrobiota bacterium]